MNLLKILVALVVGLAVGAFFCHPITVRAAQEKRSVVVVVRVEPNIEATEPSIPLSESSRVVGFSCTGELPAPVCYLAIRSGATYK